jgi:hypothetical protein
VNCANIGLSLHFDLSLRLPRVGVYLATKQKQPVRTKTRPYDKMIPPPPVEYPFNHEVWGKTFNPNDKGNWKDDIVNTHIVQRMLRWKRQGYKDFDL